MQHHPHTLYVGLCMGFRLLKFTCSPFCLRSNQLNCITGGKLISADPSLDWAANLAHQMGFDSPKALELMRLYQTIHADHEVSTDVLSM